MPLYYIRKINDIQWLCFKLLSVCVGIPIRSVYWRDLHSKLWKWKTAYVGELAGNHWSRIGKLGCLLDCSLQILAKKELLPYSVWTATVHEGKLRDSAISYSAMLNTVRLLSYLLWSLPACWTDMFLLLYSPRKRRKAWALLKVTWSMSWIWHIVFKKMEHCLPYVRPLVQTVITEGSVLWSILVVHAFLPGSRPCCHDLH